MGVLFLLGCGEGFPSLYITAIPNHVADPATTEAGDFGVKFGMLAMFVFMEVGRKRYLIRRGFGFTTAVLLENSSHEFGGFCQ